MQTRVPLARTSGRGTWPAGTGVATDTEAAASVSAAVSVSGAAADADVAASCRVDRWDLCLSVAQPLKGCVDQLASAVGVDWCSFHQR